MLRTFGIAMLLALGVAAVAALVVRRDVIEAKPAAPAAVPITISEARLIRLPVPTQGYQPYTRADVVLIGDRGQVDDHFDDHVSETREMTFVCGNGYAVRINPVTKAAQLGSWPHVFRTHAKLDEHSIVLLTEVGWTMRIDRDANTFTMRTANDEPKEGGTCRVMSAM